MDTVCGPSPVIPRAAKGLNLVVGGVTEDVGLELNFCTEGDSTGLNTEVGRGTYCEGASSAGVRCGVGRSVTRRGMGACVGMTGGGGGG